MLNLRYKIKNNFKINFFYKKILNKRYACLPSLQKKIS